MNVDIKKGRLVSDAEFFRTQTGRPKITFRLMVPRAANMPPKSSAPQNADFIQVVMYGERYLPLLPHLVKGVKGGCSPAFFAVCRGYLVGGEGGRSTGAGVGVVERAGRSGEGPHPCSGLPGFLPPQGHRGGVGRGRNRTRRQWVNRSGVQAGAESRFDRGICPCFRGAGPPAQLAAFVGVRA